MYMRPIGDLISSHGIKYHCYADDTQLYLSVENANPNIAKSKIEKCISEIREWMSENFLMLNDSKTEFVLLSSKKFDPDNLSVSSIEIGDVSIHASEKARNLGVIFDSQLKWINI